MRTVLAPCSSCLRRTKHTVLHEVKQTGEEGTELNTLLECGGCSTVSLGVKSTDASGFVTHAYYPAPVSRKLPTWAVFMRLGLDGDHEETLGDLLHEIHQAVQAKMPRLAAMGVRSLLEHLMIAKVGDHRSFEKNLDEFQKGGYISLVQRDAITALLDVGHAATHRSFKPTIEDLNLALDIVEGVLASIYEHGPAATKMTDRVPPKPSRNPKGQPSV